ncbi:MAG: DNA adenine methylase [Spirochaetaceae bacterium]|jgi:adenine-specific DNA-methyltransferase|nr:DNA adenine methylase [Spirochaetaceae bacterium]
MREPGEDPEYLGRQLITCLGNKRSLLDFIGRALEVVRSRLGRDKLALFDVFSGSGAVSRFFKRYASLLVSNDLEPYSECISRCYLANRCELPVPLAELEKLHLGLLEKLSGPFRPGFIAELYAPSNEDRIGPGERVFYTPRNAAYIDSARQYIDEFAGEIQPFFIAPLLSEASIHANTAGVFKGFYKDRSTGIGRFGGTGEDALSRIRGNIALPFPVFSRFECPVEIYREDANALARRLPELDLAYLDPPYNQHPYGSNYFMLNLITRYERPGALSPVSGIPPGWNRSPYNKKREAPAALEELALGIRAKFLLVSYNSEGFIGREAMEALLSKAGKLTVLETPYTAFRGSRNLRNREIHLREYLYLVEKS